MSLLGWLGQSVDRLEVCQILTGSRTTVREPGISVSLSVSTNCFCLCSTWFHLFLTGEALEEDGQSAPCRSAGPLGLLQVLWNRRFRGYFCCTAFGMVSHSVVVCLLYLSGTGSGVWCFLALYARRRGAGLDNRIMTYDTIPNQSWLNHYSVSRCDSEAWFGDVACLAIVNNPNVQLP